MIKGLLTGPFILFIISHINTFMQLVPFIGLMGVKNNNTLVTPSGRELFRVPTWAAWRIQHVQHWIASKTWR